MEYVVTQATESNYVVTIIRATLSKGDSMVSLEIISGITRFTEIEPEALISKIASWFFDWLEESTARSQERAVRTNVSNLAV